MCSSVGLFSFKSSGMDASADLEDRLEFLTLFMGKGSGGDPLDRMPERSRRYLRESWPHFFRTQVLGMVLDGSRAVNDFPRGPSNAAMAMLISLSILKEILALTDEELEHAVRFDLRFHYALGLDLDETDLSLHALYRFREQMVLSSETVWMFDAVVDRIIGQLGPPLVSPGVDAVHIRANMTLQIRLGGLVGGIEAFLTALAAESPDHFKALPRSISERYAKRPGGFANVRPARCGRRLELARNDAVTLLARFGEDGTINRLQSFRTLRRMQGEQVGPPHAGCRLPDSFIGSGASELMIMPGRA